MHVSLHLRFSKYLHFHPWKVGDNTGQVSKAVWNLWKKALWRYYWVILNFNFKAFLGNFNSEWKLITVLMKLYYERFIKPLRYFFILFRVKLFSEMERGWEPSNLHNSKVGCKQFNFHYHSVCSFKLVYQLHLFQDVLNIQLFWKGTACKIHQGTKKFCYLLKILCFEPWVLWYIPRYFQEFF